MTPTWRSTDAPAFAPLNIADWIKVFLRGGVLCLVLLTGVFLTLCLRIIERPLHGMRRPWSGWITVAVCRIGLRLMGVARKTTGSPMRQNGVYVANHSSWLDIFTLNACAPMYFVSKAEVATWPGIGLLARLTGTVFVRRARQEAAAQKALLEARITAGHRLTIFPEGTSTDGRQVLPFKPTLFAALFSEGTRHVHVQPVSVIYRAPNRRDRRFHAWWGDMAFGPHLLQILAAPRGGCVIVTWHEPLVVSDFADRKTLAREAETCVRRAHADGASPE
ncbi:MAG: lysophospholipid acyltransferase family protein [Pseudomonadota bacterium]